MLTESVNLRRSNLVEVGVRWPRVVFNLETRDPEACEWERYRIMEERTVLAVKIHTQTLLHCIMLLYV